MAITKLHWLQKNNEQLRIGNRQLQVRNESQRTSLLYTHKKGLISREGVENDKQQDSNFRVAKIWLNNQKWQVCCAKVRAMIEKT